MIHKRVVAIPVYKAITSTFLLFEIWSLKLYFAAYVNFFVFTDPSGKASLELSHTAIDVENSIQLSCGHNSGNPPATTYIYRNINGWSDTGLNTYQLEINSVTQETDYSCAGINYPDAHPGGLEGEVSDTKPLQVLGMIYFVK